MSTTTHARASLRPFFLITFFYHNFLITFFDHTVQTPLLFCYKFYQCNLHVGTLISKKKPSRYTQEIANYYYDCPAMQLIERNEHGSAGWISSSLIIYISVNQVQSYQEICLNSESFEIQYFILVFFITHSTINPIYKIEKFQTVFRLLRIKVPIVLSVKMVTN